MNLSKYSASGNDFVIFHTFTKKDRSALAKTLCHRQEGVGADGLIVLIPHEEHDVEWQFYNSDGSSAEMCGNGTRAAAHYAYNNALASQELSLLTKAGVITCSVEGNVVQSDLTPPIIKEKALEEFGKTWYLIDTGVPHLVAFYDEDYFNQEEARELRYKYNANVNFARVTAEGINVRTYERGVEGETLACGTGMAACFYRAFLEEKVSQSSKVYPTSKEELKLSIEEGIIKFKGAVKKTFDTTWEGV